MSKTVLVTGANTGIGYALCKLLATEHGCSVLLGSRTKSKGEKAVADIKKLAPNASVELVEIDVSSDESVSAAAAAVKAKGVTLYGLVNNAGVGLNTSADSSFVFCACAGALPGWLEGHAFAAKLTGFLVGGIALLLCVCSCQLCKVSGKIKKKKKALEDRYLSMAAGGEASHDDVEMGDNYGGNWGDDGGYTGGMPPPLEQEVI